MANAKKFFKKIINLPKALFRAGKAEVEEVKAFQLTDRDKRAGRRFAFIAIAVLRTQGIPVSAETAQILEKVGAYLIRDIKEGFNNKDELIISRIIKEIKGLEA